MHLAGDVQGIGAHAAVRPALPHHPERCRRRPVSTCDTFLRRPFAGISTAYPFGSLALCLHYAVAPPGSMTLLLEPQWRQLFRWDGRVRLGLDRIDMGRPRDAGERVPLSTLCTLSACAAAGYPLWPVGFQGSFCTNLPCGERERTVLFSGGLCARVGRRGGRRSCAVQGTPATPYPQPTPTARSRTTPSALGGLSVRPSAFDRHLSSPHTLARRDQLHPRPSALRCVAV
jgi:hypothetical protein